MNTTHAFQLTVSTLSMTLCDWRVGDLDCFLLLEIVICFASALSTVCASNVFAVRVDRGGDLLDRFGDLLARFGDFPVRDGDFFARDGDFVRLEGDLDRPLDLLPGLSFKLPMSSERGVPLE